MDRRSILKAALAPAGAGMLAGRVEPVRGERRGRRGPLPPGPTGGPFIEAADGARLFYRDLGTGKPVVFMHGWGTNADAWQYQVVHLASGRLRCVTYDRRGHGRSSDPGRGYDYDTLAGDLSALIEHLDLNGVTLVAHSMAGGEVARYLSRHGTGRVSRAVFVGTTTPFVLKTQDNPVGVAEVQLDQVRARWMTDFPKWLAENARPFFAPETSEAMLDWGMRLVLQSSMSAVIACHRILTETDFRVELGKIAVPSLIIHGDKDVSAPLELTGRRTAQLIPGSRLEVYEGAAHGLFITHMDRFNRDVRAFVGE